MSLRVLQLVGSTADDFHTELSLLYARGCAAALGERHQMRVAFVDPDGSWRFAAGLGEAEIAGAQRVSVADAVAHLLALDPDVVLPQMFCRRGMTDYRALLEVIGLPYVGNPAQVMANSADKVIARSLVSAAGVAVPPGLLAEHERQVDLPLPVVVKPAGADNSMGVTLVERRADLADAISRAATFGSSALVESYIRPGREVRCGVVEFGGDLVCLPLEEYPVDPRTAPIRCVADKFKRGDTGALSLAAKGVGRAWIVSQDDPVTAAVWSAARRCYRALGCRHYGLFDFRIDPDGTPWFLESGPYCSFAPTSVLATMAAAAGLGAAELFDRVCHEAGIRGARCPT